MQGTRARVERDSLADHDGLRTGFHGHFLHSGIVVRGRDGDARRKGLHRAVRMSSIVEDAAVRGQHRVGLARALQVRAGDLFDDDRRASRVLHTHFGGDHTRRAQGNDPGVGVVRAARRDKPLNPAIVVAGLRGRDRDARSARGDVGDGIVHRRGIRIFARHGLARRVLCRDGDLIGREGAAVRVLDRQHDVQVPPRRRFRGR